MVSKFEKLSILLLDDNIHNLNLLSSLIPVGLFSISLVKTGTAAIEVAEKVKFTLAILDINLPDINGLEVAQKIRDSQPNCEIIFCSAYSDREIREKAFNVGGVDYIEKPFDMATTRQRIKNHTDRLILQNSLHLEKARLEKMVSSMADAVVTTDLNDTIVSFNSAAEKIFKISATSAINTKFARFVPPHLKERHAKALANYKEGNSVGMIGKREPTSLTALNAHGEKINVELILSSWEENQSEFITAIIRDTSDQMVMEASLLELSNALNNTDSIIARYSDVTSGYVWMTEKYSSLIKFGNIEEGLSELVSKSTKDMASGAKFAHMREFEIQDNDESISSYLFQILPANNPTELIVFGTETSVLRSLRQQADILLDRVRTDELTGCLSRRALLDDLENGKRSQNLILAMLDIDFFKSINDYYGHNVGDLYLQRLISYLSANIPEDHLLARFGGEEFVIAFPVSSKQKVTDYLETFRQKIKEFRLISGGRTISRSVSIGAAPLQKDADIKKVLANSDEALQLAKSTGRNRVIFFDPEDYTTEFKRVNRPSLEEIKSAINLQDVYFDYQGVFNAFENNVVGYEALIRMRTQNKKIVPPNFFVDEYYHVTNVDTDDMSRAMFFRNYIDRLDKNDIGWISYNIRGSDLIGKNLSELIEFCSPDACGVQICLELSEEEITERIDLPKLRNTLETLKQHGFQIYLDDFGKERSNFHRLIELPFDVVKLDRVLIKNLGIDERSQKLVSFLTGLTKEFGMKLIAEGVETELQGRILLENNLIFHQGFLYARPQQLSES